MSKETKIKKPFYKKWWVWLIAIIVVIAIAGGSGEDETPKNADGGNKSETPAKKKAEKNKKSYGLGDAVTVGKMIYTVNLIESADQVGPSILPQKASGKYVIVDVTLKNNGNEAVTVDSSFFKLKRGEKTYEADSMGSMSANQGESGNIDTSFFLQSVNPDSEITGKVAFDVAPEVAESGELQLQVQTGVFGTETEIINLK